MRESLIILFCFCAGIFLGKVDIVPAALVEGNAVTWIIYLMLGAVGMGLGFDVRAWRIVRDLKGWILMVPAVVILGTAAGAVAAWLILGDMCLRDILAVASGFGYYSLSSMLITREADASLGSMALIANMVRELLALVLAPVFVRLVGGLGPLAAAGAASDTCLSIIIQTSGEKNAILAVFSGMLLTVLVPVFITALFAWM